MPEYRLYFVDPENHIRRRMDLDCRDDDHAVEVVREHLAHDTMELWQGDRLVRRFEAEPE